MDCRPVNDQILISVDPERDTAVLHSDVKIYKPDGACDHVLGTGEVLAVGPGLLSKKGIRKSIDLRPGEGVVFIKFVAGYTETSKSVQFVIGKDKALIRPTDVLLVYDRTDPPVFSQ
jgi:co-chaperonin GroES (HSP10)